MRGSTGLARPRLALFATVLLIALAGGAGCGGGEDDGDGSRPVDCGAVASWDGDGDGLSDNVEANSANEAHRFDPGACDDDPSRPQGTYYAGRLAGSLNLTDRGTGYLHNRGGDSVDSDDWASLGLIDCLEAVGREWQPTGLRVNVNDLSRRPGGRFPPHRSHQNGLDADLRYVRRDGLDHPLDIRRNPEEYDAAATQALFELILEHCDVAVIFVDVDHLEFSDDELGSEGRLQYSPGHSNHFHLRLKPPAGAPS